MTKTENESLCHRVYPRDDLSSKLYFVAGRLLRRPAIFISVSAGESGDAARELLRNEKRGSLKNPADLEAGVLRRGLALYIIMTTG